MRLQDIFEVHDETLLEQLDMSHRDLQEFLRAALKAIHQGDRTYVWPRDVYDDYLVYELSTPEGETLLRRDYQITNGEASFGEPVPVVAVTQYIPVESEELDTLNSEANRELLGDCVPLVERAVSEDGAIQLRIIAPGQGSSGYYSSEVLKRDGPRVFTRGLHMYLDHPTATEEAERPERSVQQLAGTLASDARWEDDGPAGPGLYAEAKVRSDIAPLIEELAPHIGVSIRAIGKASTGEVNGQRVRMIDAIEQARSVDFVTVPGAGGRVLDLMEAARRGISPPPAKVTPEETGMNKEQFEEAQRQLEEARQKIAELEAKQAAQEAREREAAIMREAHQLVTATLAEVSLPAPTRERLTKSLTVNPPVTDGALDKEALVAAVKEAVQAEAEYLASVTGSTGVTGMGGEPAKPAETPSLEESEKRISEALASL